MRVLDSGGFTHKAVTARLDERLNVLVRRYMGMAQADVVADLEACGAEHSVIDGIVIVDVRSRGFMLTGSVWIPS